MSLALSRVLREIPSSWRDLREQLGRELGEHQAVLAGELVVLDAEGRPQFYDLLRRRRAPVFVAFDLLYLDSEDLRGDPQLERKRRLEALVPRGSPSDPLRTARARRGRALFEHACALDLEGIVAKLAAAPYRQTQPAHWIKIKNPSDSQGEDRNELFEPHG
jgi:bifunctional non-homologous end joining protein LigD